MGASAYVVCHTCKKVVEGRYGSSTTWEQRIADAKRGHEEHQTEDLYDATFLNKDGTQCDEHWIPGYETEATQDTGPIWFPEPYECEIY